MIELIFATNNQNKVIEVQSLMDKNILIKSLYEAGIDIDIPEPHQTLEENAVEKSSTINRLFGKNCFSEDTGLEVDALNGEPGVRSARYAGDEANNEKNIQKLLNNLEGISNRNARFRTVISLIIDNEYFLFEGICEGVITDEIKGNKGFGYDAVFIPNGDVKTFGEMNLEEKNKYSHRKKATFKIIEFLNNYHGKN
jgi:XTP/dITP diphosphohydrolase